jgi:hypothetical protein
VTERSDGNKSILLALRLVISREIKVIVDSEVFSQLSEIRNMASERTGFKRLIVRSSYELL